MFEDNRATSDGGAVRVSGGAWFYGCTILGNHGDRGGPSVTGESGSSVPESVRAVDPDDVCRAPDAAGHARVRVFDAGGRLALTIVDSAVQPGWHALSWDGRSGRGEAMASGTCHFRIETGAGVARCLVPLVR